MDILIEINLKIIVVEINLLDINFVEINLMEIILVEIIFVEIILMKQFLSIFNCSLTIIMMESTLRDHDYLFETKYFKTEKSCF